MYEERAMSEFGAASAVPMPPLDGVRVIDAATDLGAYVGRLLSDLGADVLKLESPHENTNHAGDAEGWGWTRSAALFRRVGKTAVILDPADPDAADELAELLSSAQMLITSEGPDALEQRGLGSDVVSRHPGLVHVAVTPYGLDGPYANRPATDLTLLAAGGLLSLAGEPDREPVRPFGEQSYVATSLHATVGALIALLVLDDTGQGQVVDVSAQEAVAHSLENAIQYADLEGTVRRRAGSAPTEAGTGLFACRDGWVYLVCGLGGYPLGWDGLVEWLLEGGVEGAHELRSSRWSEPGWRRSVEAVAHFRALFERFTADRSKQNLYEAGQRHGVSIAPVSTPADLLDNPQLVARCFFRRIQVDGESVTVPGPPYRFAGIAVGP